MTTTCPVGLIPPPLAHAPARGTTPNARSVWKRLSFPLGRRAPTRFTRRAHSAAPTLYPNRLDTLVSSRTSTTESLPYHCPPTGSHGFGLQPADPTCRRKSLNAALLHRRAAIPSECAPATNEPDARLDGNGDYKGHSPKVKTGRDRLSLCCSLPCLLPHAQPVGWRGKPVTAKCWNPANPPESPWCFRA